MGGIFSSNNQLRAKREKKEQRSQKFLSFVRSVRTWHLMLLLLPLLFLAATFLRIDHIRMTNLRDAVLTADAEGDEAKIANALKDLRAFTSRHITVNFLEKNGREELIFGTGPFYLEGQYNRAASAAIAEAEKRAAALNSESGVNGNMFSEALAACKIQNQLYGWNAFMSCFYNVVDSFPTTDSLTVQTIVADIPTTALYRYDFASPIWYPSFSGWTILLCIVLIILIACRILYWLVLQIALAIVK